MLSCPFPISDYPYITMAHGGGGSLSKKLIDELISPVFSNPLLDQRNDGASFITPGDSLAFSTDSHVVSPIFFPGGDIGHLAICGTVNDIAMCGAQPSYLSVGFILEEGFPTNDLWKVLQSMKRTADDAKVQIVTGDTKVVEKGKGDGIYINTSGVGVIKCDPPPAPTRVQAGDVVILSGDIGRHGIAIMAAREGLELETTLKSDCALLNEAVMSLIDAGIELHCLRDLTRGGLASGVIEIMDTASLSMEIDESTVPISKSVRSVCEILGLDPFYTANEGRFIAIVPATKQDKALAALRSHPLGNDARIIGKVSSGDPGLVTVKTSIGTHRILTMLSGEQLPRIC
ncbi:hydrogenase expression/formation protein HypE [Pelagicoccus mobilis]|uniref:Hydrogenase expression/formation protein HypE n=1 Tax=Pelagicoccus mobilis TaxID=415221 RepID=A0A934VK33_9BACT|nr:hydrogenase expression/formation protein HypE [Pelagicoccus mobilis]MBK1876246.1 hydrogenase expression/formation protein HypE [Pelagicoccus mobilis]